MCRDLASPTVYRVMLLGPYCFSCQKTFLCTHRRSRPVLEKSRFIDRDQRNHGGALLHTNMYQKAVLVHRAQHRVVHLIDLKLQCLSEFRGLSVRKTLKSDWGLEIGVWNCCRPSSTWST